MKKYLYLVVLYIFASRSLFAANYLLEAESFTHKGGWVDQQFMDLMGSPYLMAHGLGQPVNDASTRITLPQTGTYYIYVRTYNWTSPWRKEDGPGKFKLIINNNDLPVLGNQGESWIWQSAGRVTVENLQVTVTLHDLTGFNGRCDAIFFTTNPHFIPPGDVDELAAFRRNMLGLPDKAPQTGNFDLAVVGGGVAGISAAISAARLGCKVALINDRPVLGGNNSSEIRVHLGGRIEAGPYKELGNLQKEFGPLKEGNAQRANYYEDSKKSLLMKKT
ncbi:FAD-dependent oxidoreductase [Bacteroides sp. 519]|nr:FAD-dependent oxidoreductase [Bacteroides sp. 519]